MVIRRIFSFARRHPVGAAGLGAGAAALFAFGIYWFGPQDLVVDERVEEAIPTVAPAAVPGGDASMSETEQSPGAPVELARGEFRGLAHDASGTALVLELEDGRTVLRFEDLEVSNGPDLKVYVSTARSGADGSSFDDQYVSLGDLKGNVGDQNYVLPEDLRLSRYRSAVVWCERFAVGFAVAPIEST